MLCIEIFIIFDQNWSIVFLSILIIKKRKVLEISQTVLAARLGISNDYLCKIEKGEKLISKARLSDISNILQIDKAVLDELWLVDKILLLLKKEDNGDNIKSILLNEFRNFI